MTTQGNGVDQLFAPNFRTPYSIQLNAGIQHEFRPGTVLSVDYVRNRGLHYLVYYDTNHVGAARYLDKNAAQNAISTTLANCGVGPSVRPSVTAPASRSELRPTRELRAAQPTFRTLPATASTRAPAIFAYGAANSGAAFPGVNSSVGQNEMLYPIGHSTYNGLDVSLKQQVKNPMPGVKGLNLPGFVLALAPRFDGPPTRTSAERSPTLIITITTIGPSALDRTNQFSFGGVFNLVHGFQLSLIAHADSSLPQTLTVSPGAQRVATTAQIFQSDLTGDGTTETSCRVPTSDPSDAASTPATSTTTSTPTTPSMPGSLPLPGKRWLPPACLPHLNCNNWVRSLRRWPTRLPARWVWGDCFTADLGLTYIAKIHESITLQPSITFYNVTNSQNFDQGTNLLSGILQAAGAPSSGSANNTTYGERTTHVTLGSGVYGQGGPRVMEFGLKFTF